MYIIYFQYCIPFNHHIPLCMFAISAYASVLMCKHKVVLFILHVALTLCIKLYALKIYYPIYQDNF